jgi:hypothetical protein
MIDNLLMITPILFIYDIGVITTNLWNPRQ